MIRKIFVLALALTLVAFAGVWAVDKSKMEPAGDAVLLPQDQPSVIDGDFLLNYAGSLSFLYPVPDALPSGSLDTWEGMHFVAPSAGKLKSIRVRLINRSGATVNDTINSMRLSVFGNDATCDPPGVPDSSSVLLDIVVPNATLLLGGWPAGSIKTFTVDVSSFNVNVAAGQIFHVMSMTAPGDLGQNWHILDDGTATPGGMHWGEWGPGCSCPDASPAPFHNVETCFGPGTDLNVHIAVTLSAPKVPSLTTYGLIGLTVLLLGTGVWMFRKKITPVNTPNLG